MGEGLQFAFLAALVGKKHGARYGTRRVTIGAVGWKDGERFVMGTFSDGSVVLGAPGDFTVPPRRGDGDDKPSRPVEPGKPKSERSKNHDGGETIHP